MPYPFAPRFPTKGRITTPELKVVTLLQAELNDFIVLDSAIQQESSKVLKAFTRTAIGEEVPLSLNIEYMTCLSVSFSNISN